MKRQGFVIKRLFFSIISISLVFLLLELSAGLLNPLMKISHAAIDLGVGGKDVLEYPSGYIKDKELFWRLQPSFGEYNSKGFRDKEFSFQKKNNTFRIICMGDSVTFGWPTKIENTYPKILERLLNSQFTEKNFEVFNAGVPGYTSFQGLMWLQKEIIKYTPDLIIVYYGINDRAGSYKPDKEQRVLPRWIIRIENHSRKFQFYRLLNKIVLYFKYPPSRESHYSAHRVSPQDYKKNLENMIEIGEKNGFKTVFIVKPVFYDPEKKYILADDVYVLPKDILQFDIYSIFKEKENEVSKLFLDDIRPLNFHLTDKGQMILAEAVFSFLIKNEALE